MMDRPRTILQLLPRLDTGGAERVALEIAQAVQHAGHISLMVAENGPLTHAARRAGVEVIHLPVSTKNPFKIWLNTRKLRKIIKHRQVDLIHAHSRAPAWSGGRAAQQTGVTFITTYHGTYGEKSRLKKRYNQVMVAGARVVAVSRFIAELIEARYQINPARIAVIYNGVDPVKFAPESVRGDRAVRLAKAWRIENGQPAILLPARLTGWKGQHVFIRALAQMQNKEAVGILIGSDQGRHGYTQELLALAEQLGVGGRLRLVGHVEDMPAALKLADVVVNCSTEPEAFGRTIIEAQAMGKIVVATDHGGARETIIPNVSGFLVPPGNVEALALALDTILEGDMGLRLAFGAQARAEVVEHFSQGIMQARYMALYEELLS